MDPSDKIYTIDEFRCWKVENLDDERSDENKNEGGANANCLQACVVGMQVKLAFGAITRLCFTR
jgi:hypothetical protein